MDDELARSAAAALGPGWSVALGERLRAGSQRSLVVRAVARRGDDERAVVLKLAVDGGPGGVREEAALRLLTRRGAPGVVPLLGVGDPAAGLPVLVLADLGAAPTLADALLGDDAAAATDALVRWASAVGRLQASTSDAGETYAAALAEASPLGPPAADSTREALADAVVALRRELPRLGVELTGAAADELRGIGEHLARTGTPRGLVPGDTCPDNAVLVGGDDAGAPEGIRLLDLEGAEHRHVVWEAAYLLLPWPSCWCSWRLPGPAVDAALAAWRAAVTPAVPPGCSDVELSADLDAAVVAWTAVSAGWFLPAALGDDPGPTDTAKEGLVPRRRALLQHRTRVAAERAGTAWPALAGWAEQLHAAAVDAWGDRPLDVAPAYR